MTAKKGKHWWTNEEIAFLKKKRKEGKTFSQVAKLMEKKFKQSYTRAQIGSAVRRYANDEGYKYRPGNERYNWIELGTERHLTRGYTRVKTANGIWEYKHRVKYREYYGEIPKGCVIIFANGDKTDFRKENLIALTRNQLKTMNKYNLIKEDIDATKTGAIIADIIIKTEQVKKNL